MRVYLECIPCFVRQALQATQFCGADTLTQERVLRSTLRALDEMPWDGSPMDMARTIHGIVRQETGSNDPYRRMKEKSNHQALDWYASLAADNDDTEASIDTSIRLAIAGNIVDYGANPNVDPASAIEALLAKPFALSHESQFLQDVAGAKTIGYLADNAGEIVFDRLLLETVNRMYGPKKYLFVTRKEPFINDVLVEDTEAVGLTALPGVDVAAMHPLAPAAMTAPEDRRLWDRLRSCDVIISKGQANYEGFSGEPGIYFLLVVKCPVIARDLESQTGTPLRLGDMVLWNSGRKTPSVAKLRKPERAVSQLDEEAVR